MQTNQSADRKLRSAVAVIQLFLPISVATAVASAAVIAAEQIAQRAVFPHGIYKRDEYGCTASGKHAFQSVFGAACSYEQENEYPKAAVAASEL